jgi:hypothetical protein
MWIPAERAINRLMTTDTFAGTWPGVEARRVPDGGSYLRSPRLAVDGSGTAWLAFVAGGPEGERPMLAPLSVDGGAIPGGIRPLDGWNPMVTTVTLAPAPEGVLAAWISGDAGTLSLCFARCFAEGAEPARAARVRGEPSQVALCAAGAGFAAAWIEREAGGHRLAGALLDGTGAVTAWTHPADIDGIAGHPALAGGDGKPWTAWQEFAPDGASRILVRPPGARKPRIAVEHRGGGCAARPALAADGAGGAWLAWHSDVDEAAGPTLVRWIEIAHIDGKGRISLPPAPMPGIERHGREEDQGFEFPSLASGPDGRLTLVGRGSQGLYRQDLGRDGFGPRWRLDGPGWACRGVPAAVATPEALLVATRERSGLVVRSAPWGEAGPGSGPALSCPRTPLRIPATGRASLPSPRSHPSLASAPRPGAPGALINGRRVLFGDLHQHTAASDGTGTRPEAFHRARFRYGDDLAAVADHESFVGKRTPPGEWLAQCAEADAAYAPGEFVTLHAFEWTGRMHPGPGHRVVYLPPGGGPVLSRDDPATKESAELVEACRVLGALAAPHHVGWTGADMESHDPAVQPVWEIVSAHGAYERPGAGPIGTRGDDKPGQFAAEALDAGLRFGFAGGSDGHGLAWHHGICRTEDSHRTGLTAVLAEPTRASVLEALRRRRCYATSGAKIGLWFEVAGRPMGSEIPVSGPVRFRVVVRGTAPLARVVLVTNGGAERELPAQRRSAECRGALPAPAGWSYHFVRVEQQDGHAAWSSPIWLDRAP